MMFLSPETKEKNAQCTEARLQTVAVQLHNAIMQVGELTGALLGIAAAPRVANAGWKPAMESSTRCTGSSERLGGECMLNWSGGVS